jgi:hypothetical protein
MTRRPGPSRNVCTPYFTRNANSGTNYLCLFLFLFLSVRSCLFAFRRNLSVRFSMTCKNWLPPPPRARPEGTAN